MNLKNITTLIVFTLIFTTSIAQAQSSTECNLQKENEVWLAKFKQTNSLAEQLELIQQKIIADSVYTRFKSKITTPHSSTIINYTDINNNLCGRKILFTIDSHKIDINEQPALSPIVRNITASNIKSIQYMEPKTAAALFGAHSEKGAVLIQTKNNEVATQLKQTRTP
ncbi:hypothetical protein [Joostella sp. CR20]|uniref:hypothetical protein n=1 Tax=Joostella sp. CR20 TaxID=2804312 RepID=UPI00313B6940